MVWLRVTRPDGSMELIEADGNVREGVMTWDLALVGELKTGDSFCMDVVDEPPLRIRALGGPYVHLGSCASLLGGECSCSG